MSALPADVSTQIKSLSAGDPQIQLALSGKYKVLESVSGSEAGAVLAKLSSIAQGDPRWTASLIDEYGALRAKNPNMTTAESINQVSNDFQQQQKGAADKQASDGTKQFLGFKWGLGVALTSGLNHGDRVSSASVVNQVVKVTQTTNQQPRIVLEIHHFFCAGQETCDAVDSPGPKPLFGYGPWVGIQSSSDQVIDSYALGFMVGWRTDATSSASFNLGLGLIVDAKVQVLDGVKANQPLPAGLTSVPLKNESRTGAIVIASFGF